MSTLNIIQQSLEGPVQRDAVLLRRFLDEQDGDAFAQLVQRHGAMVHAVCRRVLGNVADAEDAAQAVFLVLAKAATRIRQSQDLGGWFFGVARKVALQALRERTRREKRERLVVNRSIVHSTDVLEAQEAARLCDAELLRLPARYRQALVLSCVEGLPKSLVAQRLGWPEGTVASCISRGKKLLAQRLIRQGVAPALATAVLSTPAAQAIPVSLHQVSTLALAQVTGQSLKHLALPGALHLVYKVNSHMLIKRSVTAVACTLGLVAVMPGILRGWQSWMQPPEVVSASLEPVAQEKAASSADAPPRIMTDKESLQGRWMLVAMVSNKNEGFDPFAGTIIGSMIEFQGDDFLQYQADGSKIVIPKEVNNLYRLNDKVEPKELDVIMKAPSKEFIIPGLYSLQHDTLIICTSQPINARPMEISAARNGSTRIAIYRRVTEKGAMTVEQKRIREELVIAQTNRSLRDCLIAMHNYHNDYNRLPAPAIFDKQTGTPLLSWRVMMLPYLNEDKLYKEFHLNESWDSEHNKKLIARMPRIFAHPGTSCATEFKTHYRVFVSPSKIDAGNTGNKFAPAFSLLSPVKMTLGAIAVCDGTANTISVVEATEPVIWTRPDEIMLENDEADIPSLGAVPGSPYFLAVHWDGASHLYRRTGERMTREMYLKLLRQQIGWKDGMNYDVSGILVR